MTNYNNVVSELMSNDRNGFYDEILKDNDNNTEEATKELIEVLENLIEEYKTEAEYTNFLQIQLNKLK